MMNTKRTIITCVSVDKSIVDSPVCVALTAKTNNLSTSQTNPTLLTPHSSIRVHKLPQIALAIFLKLLRPTSENATQGIGGHNRIAPHRSKCTRTFFLVILLRRHETDLRAGGYMAPPSSDCGITRSNNPRCFLNKIMLSFVG
jgi:hypothetical protein